MDDGSHARAAATASTYGLGGGDTPPTPDPEAAVTRSTSGVGGGDSTQATASATNARGGGDSTQATDPEASATSATNGGGGVGGGDSTEATDPEAAATNGGGGGGGEAEQEQERLHAYAAAYSGRTLVARLISIAKWSAVETTQLEALRIALVEVKRGGDTRRYGDICNLIGGRITPTYDRAWVESVDESFKQRLQVLQEQMIQSKVMENAKFLYFLRLLPQVWQLVHSFYNGEHRSCMIHLEAIKPNILPDIHIGEHVKTLYFVISQKSGYIAVPGLEDLFPTSSRILIEGGPTLNEEGEEQPTVEETQPQNVHVSNLVLPDEFDDETALVVSAHYKFLKAKDLLVSIGKRSLSWVSKLNAYALLMNAQLFVHESVHDEEGRFDGRTVIVSEAKRVSTEVRYSSYTTTRKTLKETRIVDKEDSAVDRFQIKGNVWTRRRICLKNDQRYHLLQWRKSVGLRRAQAQPPEAASQNDNAQLNETMKSLIDQLKDHTNAVTHNTETLTQTRQIMLELNNSLAEARTTAATARTGGEAP